MLSVRCVDVHVCSVHTSLAHVGHDAVPRRLCAPSPSSRAAFIQAQAYSNEPEESVSEFLERRQREMRTYAQTSNTQKGPKHTVRTLLGVDYSASKTGVAVFKTPSHFVDGAKRLVDIAKELGCDGIVVGVPLTPNQRLWDTNQDSRIGRRCRNFAYTVAMVSKPVDLHVFIVSERYSTSEASILLEGDKRKKRAKKDSIDAASAAIVLDRFFMDREGSVLMKQAFGLVQDSSKPS